jgi:hypothetical protein
MLQEFIDKFIKALVDLLIKIKMEVDLWLYLKNC